MAVQNAELQRKLREFESTIMEQVGQRCKEIHQEMKDYQQHELEKFEDGVLQDTYHLIAKQVSEIRMETMREVARRRMEKKRELHRRREEYTQLVFAEARARLSEYVQKPEYREFLLQKVKNLAAQCPKEGAELLVREADLPLAKELQQAFGAQCPVHGDEGITLGGVLVRNTAKGILMDETLDTALERQREWFCAESDFVVAM